MTKPTDKALPKKLLEKDFYIKGETFNATVVARVFNISTKQAGGVINNLVSSNHLVRDGRGGVHKPEPHPIHKRTLVDPTPIYSEAS